MAKRYRRRRPTAGALWRWRRNPLRRTSDLVEAWVLLAAWVLTVVGGAAVGVMTAVVAERSFEGDRSERRAIAAELVTDASNEVSTHAGDRRRAWAKVQWTAPDGKTRRTGRTKVPTGARAGSQVQVWTDAKGGLTSRPADPSEALVEATAVGVLATAATVGVVWVSTRAVRAVLDRRRMVQWAVEWELIHTRRGGKTG
ncbi:Rv1733c family protein [Streptomyces sp. NPDC003758]|uniref:Integral membrane protein n=1 Tax=Streptomyces cynarae TaxID=2981134 RepID=A0ABY6DTZ3_9ACTN|nr:hypothetical protein [Streptomyces cynarae]UXY17703.1 hypothetical protein N8I84_02295 [Streptomyces cynarae]